MIYTVKVAVPVLLNRLFDYSVEADAAIAPSVGCRVVVPFGRNNKKYVGVILAVKEEDQRDDSVKPVEQIIDEQPLFLKENIEFLKWISDYYLTPIGEVFRAAQPTVIKFTSTFCVKTKAASEEEIAELEQHSSGLAAIYSFIASKKSGECTRSVLEKNEGKNSFTAVKKALAAEPEKMSKYFEIREILPQEVRQNGQVKCIRIAGELLEDTALFKEELEKLENKKPKRAMVIHLFNVHNPHNEFVSLKVFSNKFGIKPDLLARMIQSGYFEMEMCDKSETDEEFNLAKRKESDLPLTDEQQNVLNRLEEKFDASDRKPTLLYGITGSGKTLVYMHLIKKVLAAGKTVIIILPEISLTPQLSDRFEKSFPGMLAIFHSRMSAGEKANSLKGLVAGTKRIVLGARSALFAPCKNLGLIIVDEEHDRTFKQQSPRPRYNARDCAVMRAYFEKAQVILGSATPSLESMYNAQIGKYELLKLENRADGATLPKIKIIDMLSASKHAQIFRSLSFDLLENIKQRLERGEGVILFQNRRGYAPYLQCHDCADIHGCPNCSVNLTYHKDRNELVCHYCGYSEKLVKYCTHCGSVRMEVRGSGTQQIEEELNEYFKDFPRQVAIERFDTDSTSKKGDYRRILKRFAQGETDILVGTQMVAKGIDFDRVSLVGIVNADDQLFYPDFRAAENAFQLMTQVSGRAGRSGGLLGEVYIQTSKPEDLTISAVQRNDYFGFFKKELQIRRETEYPPFSRLCIVEFSSPDRSKAISHGEIFFSLLKKEKNVKIYEPVSPVIEKICERFRRIIVLKDMKGADPAGANLREVLHFASAEYFEKYASADVRLSIDIDA